jgi:serine protease Do
MKTTRSTDQLNLFNWSQFKQLSNSNKKVGNFALYQSPVHLLLLSLIGTGLTLIAGCGASDLSSQEVAEPPQNKASQAVVSPTTSNNTSNRPLTPTAADNNFVVDVVKKVEPAVVQINTSQTERTQEPDEFGSPLLRRFREGQAQERISRGVGSGFVISSNGQILTNSHVVNKADTVTVSFSDGRTLAGKVVGEDPASDIAVVQVQANNLPTVTLGHSAQVEPGQWAIAIGNPLGLQKTVTVGVISATSRSGSDIGISDKRIDFLQTDAAINPGNSGGPLLNARGEVIGINTAIISGAQGLGFAIPIDTAQRIAQQLITTGKVEHPYLGVQMVTLTPEIKQRLSNNPNQRISITAERGIIIVRVARNSPADKAGIQPGDVIQAINNQQINKAEELQQQLEKNGVGSQLQIQLQRGSQTLKLAARPEALPAQAQ